MCVGRCQFWHGPDHGRKSAHRDPLAGKKGLACFRVEWHGLREQNEEPNSKMEAALA